MGISLSKDKQTPSAALAPEPEPEPEVPRQKPRLPRSGSLLGIDYKDVNEDFKILRAIGRGKFAVTHLCRERSTGKKYACKQIPKKRLVTNSEKKDLNKEVEIMTMLSGAQNVVELKATYEDAKYVHLVMEYCEGGELYDKMVSKGMFTEKVAAQILGSIMKFLALLHGMGIMHRDLKPENFLLPKKSALGFVPCAQKGTLGPCLADYSMLKAIDFGLSAYIDEVTQEKVGTAFYVAPEVLRRQPYGEKVDIWSAGVILYMLLTGAPPFYGDTDEQIFDRILQSKKPDMESYPWTKRSDKAKKLVENMLSWDPKKRPTATEVLNDQWLKDNGVEITIDAKFYDKLKHFRAMHKFKKVALKILMTEIIPQEELEELKAMFYNGVTDERKVISSEKLKSSLAKLEPKYNSEEIELIVNAADADRNGDIDYEEFITAMMNFKRQHKADELRKVFERFDKDKNGSISKEELRSALEEYKLRDEAIEEIIAQVEEIIAQVDVNKDGQISYKEFCEMMEK